MSARRLALFAVTVFALAANAAPVPKGMKKPKPPSIAGLWEVVEFLDDGKPGKIPGRYCRFTDDTASELLLQPHALYDPNFDTLAYKLSTPDPNRPEFKQIVFRDESVCSAVYEVDGDELREAFAHQCDRTLTECKPGVGVHFYRYKRVADPSK